MSCRYESYTCHNQGTQAVLELQLRLAALSYSTTSRHPEGACLDADAFKVRAYRDTTIWW